MGDLMDFGTVLDGLGGCGCLGDVFSRKSLDGVAGEGEEGEV